MQAEDEESEDPPVICQSMFICVFTNQFTKLTELIAGIINWMIGNFLLLNI